ncbi:hypothetical protein QQ045_013753 [Rhodiola kirilowii]
MGDVESDLIYRDWESYSTIDSVHVRGTNCYSTRGKRVNEFLNFQLVMEIIVWKSKVLGEEAKHVMECVELMENLISFEDAFVHAEVDIFNSRSGQDEYEAALNGVDLLV